MKKYILIQNDGEIETNSFELIGASTKRNDETKIGFFGSGLKYSIAFMMRNNIDFKIFSGNKEVVFTTKQELLKDQTFERICINGIPTSYTTTMGPTWEFQWFVLREIYCNAIDEGTCQLVKSTENVCPSEGKTRIYIELTDNLRDVINNWDKYFSDEREPIAVIDNVHTSYLSNKCSDQQIKIYKKTNGSLFRKGVMVYSNEKYLYDYEVALADINEDRTAKHPVALQYGFVSMMSSFSSEQFVLSVLRNMESAEYLSLRGTSNYTSVSEKWINFSNDYLLVVKEVSGKYSGRIQDNPKEALLIPSSFALELKKEHHAINILGMGKIIGDLSMEEVNTTPKMEYLLKEVVASLKEMKYEIPYDIFVAEFKDENIMGKADVPNKKIYIADKTFDMGRRELALTLMEETEHIKSKAEDETRQFQTHIFSQWLKTMEESNALFL
jgi:hypothetical protein